MPKDPAVLAHQDWLGYVQPVGLVVSIPAMLDANARINQNFAPEHRRFLDTLPSTKDGEPVAEISDFPAFAQNVLGWSLNDLYGAPDSPEVLASLEVPLPEYHETLRPTYALRDFQPPQNASEWILLVKVLPAGTDFDAAEDVDSRHWQASPQAKFERLLRQVKVPIGLLVNAQQIRLVYAPEKELSGHITFKLPEMVKVAGRAIFAAFHMLLSAERLYSVAERERLPAILENSRKYQNVVSTQLASQVLEALYELLRGFQAANDQSQGELLRDVLAQDPNLVYRGLLTTLLRLVFVLYAEDRGLLSTDPVYSNYYSVTGLYDRLRVDHGRYPDTMDQRFGAWAQLLTLFRLIYRGGSHGGLRIPAREGYLFDPDRYPFLEGRRNRTDKVNTPRVPDGVLFRVLSKLMLLDGERISYRTLAVEQIGSVYEAIMGFELHVASGLSIAIKPAKKHGAPTTINLEELLRATPDRRLRWFQEHTDQKLAGSAIDALKAAKNVDDLQAAMAKKIAVSVTPDLVAKGAMIFQPSDERRRTGSHYTPSNLTGPIVEAALAPMLKQLGENPTPAQILNLKVCDPAMGSGAFLVEACRQLGDALSKAWHAHDQVPVLPPDEDEVLHAQRQIAQRCLYGVDKNPMATDLAKLSLWLATLAKDHPFTFLDHSLRTGDSLVGLTRKQIAAFTWGDDKQQSFIEQEIRTRIERVSRYRQRILAARDDVPYAQLKQELEGADEALQLARQVGDTVVAAFFSADKPKAQENARLVLRDLTEFTIKDPTDEKSVREIEEAVITLRRGPKGITPFHWELEFPEVFSTASDGERAAGFDAMVGNPPFAGKNTLIAAHQEQYPDWLKSIHDQSHGNADLVAHFFRRAFVLLRIKGCMGLIATKTIGQGDTRSTGLRWICLNGGTIYRAKKRLKWPGEASVTISVVHCCKGFLPGPYLLNERPVDRITAYLFHDGGNEDPATLGANAGRSFIGSYVLGMGFTFDDTDTKGVATPIAEMHRLIAEDSTNAERIFPYIGGEEVNNSPTHAHHRYVINFENFPLKRCDLGQSWAESSDQQRKNWIKQHRVPWDYPWSVASDWPELLKIVETKVKPERLKQASIVNPDRWWMFARSASDLRTAAKGLRAVLAINCGASPHMSWAILPPEMVYSHTLTIIAEDSSAWFALLQSHVHEVWAQFFASSMEDRLRYTPSDCFRTFPLPELFKTKIGMEEAGRAYHEFRAQLMIRNTEGLTATYNRFNDPYEDSADFRRLRELHDTMDRAILDAYGWHDIQPICQFFPEFDDEEEGDEDGRPKRKKYRYRWPEEIHDEVLARLLDLNRQRALEGQVLTATESTAAAAPRARRPKKKAEKTGVTNDAHSLFVEEEKA